MFDEAAVRETEHVQRLARDDDAGLVDAIPTKTHRSPLLVGNELLDGHVDTLVATHCLHDRSKAIGASNLLVVQALMIHVLRGDQRRDQIESTNVEDLDDLAGERFGLGHRAPLLTDGQIVSDRPRVSWTPSRSDAIVEHPGQVREISVSGVPLNQGRHCAPGATR
jgi:hypothetical protein